METDPQYRVRHPAAFINNIMEEGTKEEAVRELQKLWDDYRDLSNLIEERKRSEGKSFW